MSSWKIALEFLHSFEIILFWYNLFIIVKSFLCNCLQKFEFLGKMWKNNDKSVMGGGVFKVYFQITCLGILMEEGGGGHLPFRLKTRFCNSLENIGENSGQIFCVLNLCWFMFSLQPFLIVGFTEEYLKQLWIIIYSRSNILL